MCGRVRGWQAPGTQSRRSSGSASGRPPPVVGPPPSPTVAAAEATAELHLPTPTPGYWPTRSAVVNFPEWLWIDASIWHPISVSATATNAGGSTTVTATATPRYVEWHMGDSQRLAQYFGPTDIPSYAPADVRCSGPGVVHILTQVYSAPEFSMAVDIAGGLRYGKRCLVTSARDSCTTYVMDSCRKPGSG